MDLLAEDLLAEEPPWLDKSDSDSDGDLLPFDLRVLENELEELEPTPPVVSLEPLPTPPVTPSKVGTATATPLAGLETLQVAPLSPTPTPKRPPKSADKKTARFPLLLDVETRAAFVVVREQIRASPFGRSGSSAPQLARVTPLGVFFNREQAFSEALEHQLVEAERVAGKPVPELRRIVFNADRPFETRLDDARCWLDAQNLFGMNSSDGFLIRVELTEFKEPRAVSEFDFRGRFPDLDLSDSPKNPASPPEQFSVQIDQLTLDPVTCLPISLPPPVSLPLSGYAGRYSPTHITLPTARPLLPSELSLAVLDLSLGGKHEWGSCYLVEGISCRFAGPWSLGQREMGGWELPERTGSRGDEVEKDGGPSVLKMTWKPTSVMASRLTEAQRTEYDSGVGKAELELLQGGWAVLTLRFPVASWVGNEFVRVIMQRKQK